MEREVVMEGASVEEAMDAALDRLGVQQDAVEYEVLDEPSRKLFGSDRPAKVRVWLKASFLKELDQAADKADQPAPAEEAPAGAEPEEPPRSVEDIDRVADEAAAAMREVLSAFGIEAEIEEYEGDEGEIILDIVGGELGILIGRHGRTLDAFQVLVSAITHKRTGFRHPILVDVAGYRYRRRAKLEEIATRAAERASRQGRPVPLRPMSSYERRLVHIALREDGRVTTASEGAEPFRHVVVMPR